MSCSRSSCASSRRLCSEMTRKERARIAVALRELGLTGAEIARRMEISPSYAVSLYSDPSGEAERKRKDGYRRPCPGCGALMDGSEGEGPRAPQLCKDCARAGPDGEQAMGPSRSHRRYSRVRSDQWSPRIGSRMVGSKTCSWVGQYPPASAGLSLRTQRTRQSVIARAQNHPFASWAEAIEAGRLSARPKAGRQGETHEEEVQGKWRVRTWF